MNSASSLHILSIPPLRLQLVSCDVSRCPSERAQGLLLFPTDNSRLSLMHSMHESKWSRAAAEWKVNAISCSLSRVKPIFSKSTLWLRMKIRVQDVSECHLLVVCVCVCVCVSPLPRLLITSGVVYIWTQWLVKQVLQLLYGNCSDYS